MIKLRNIILLCYWAYFACNYIYATNKEAGNLREYMQTQSLIWEQLPLQWNEGAFLGNGRVGMVVYVDTVDNSLALWHSRSDVTDHRLAPDKKSSLGVKGASVGTDFCRMDVGKMKLYPEAKILSGTMELDIFDAILSGVLHTDKGDILIRAFTSYELEVNVVEVKTSIPYHWKQIPGSPRSPRVHVFPQLEEQLGYKDNPDPECVSTGKEGWAVYPLLAGGDYATYWKQLSDKDVSTLFFSTKNEVPKSGLSLSKAKKEVEVAISKGTKMLRVEMQSWWNSYYKTGLISIPDKKMENFYHIQLYKLATCSHPNGPVMDTLGMFYKTSQWPGIWWNLNVQLTYMATHATNRLSQGVNYQNLLDDLFGDLLDSMGAGKIGDFTWALHTYYSYMRYAGSSWKEIGLKFMPKAKEIYKLYKPHLKEINGVFHLIDTESPEYEGFKTYDNSNYNLAALRWLLQTMLKVGNQGKGKSEEYEEWKSVLSKLHPAPTDENGYMIASGTPVAKSHRHYSHLLAFYPYKLQDVTESEENIVLAKSIDHWMGIDNGRELAGFSFTGAASLYAYQGNGDKAYEQLYRFLNKPIGISLLLPNTLYVESGGKNPCLETPLSAATAMTEMLLQAWGGTLRVFPAIPKSWEDCSFESLRTEGGFVVSASKKAGKVNWIRIHSDAGQPCRIYLPYWDKVCQIKGSKICIEPDGKGYYTLKIPKGKTIVLAGNKDTVVEEVFFLPQEEDCHNYGVKQGQGLPRQMDW